MSYKSKRKQWEVKKRPKLEQHRPRVDLEAPRRWLQVPYAEKEHAKSVGARWDGLVKMWWVPMSISVSRVQKWLLPTDPARKKQEPVEA